MNAKIVDAAEDYGTLVLTPSEDDHFEVSGYGTRGEIAIRIPLYSHEARDIIAVLRPLAGTDAPCGGN